jgi:aryl-alcohol dehydrogenase-like predicted oxidoreductase
MLARERVEEEYAPLFSKYNLGTTVWSPLATGILTGKYNEGLPRGSRLDKVEWLRERLTPEKIEKVKKLEPVANSLGCTLSQLAIAWCLKNPNVDTVILGASNIDQLRENLGALEVKAQLTEKVMGAIEEII